MREEVAAVWFVCRVRIAMGSSIAACRVVIFLLAEVLLDQQENRVVFQAVQRRPAGGRASGAFGTGVGPRMEDAQRRLLHEKRAWHAGEGIGTSCTCARGRRRLMKNPVGRGDREEP